MKEKLYQLKQLGLKYCVIIDSFVEQFTCDNDSTLTAEQIDTVLDLDGYFFAIDLEFFSEGCWVTVLADKWGDEEYYTYDFKS